VTPAPGGRSRLDVVSFGSVFLEMAFGHTDQLPRPGEEIFIDSFAFSCGGAITSAVEASRVGASAAMASVLGDDLGSRLAERLCLAEGVDLYPSRRVKGPVAGITVVLNYDSDRAFVSHMPARAAAERPETERWCDVLDELRPGWAYLHAGPEAVAVLEKARSLGTKVALDVNFGEIDEYPEAVVSCARLADAFLPNEEELRRITGSEALEQAIAVAASWSPLVVVKRGARGAVVSEGGRTTEVPDGLLDVEVQDLTGAGDAFAGALIGSLAKGVALFDSVAAANAAGSEAAGRLGATGPLDVPEVWSSRPLLTKREDLG
jgi:sugar/nucleoside kinase (ribokinase family)